MEKLREYLELKTVPILMKGDQLLLVPKTRRHTVKGEDKETLCAVVTRYNNKVVIVNLIEEDKPNTLTHTNQLRDALENVNSEREIK